MGGHPQFGTDPHIEPRLEETSFPLPHRTQKPQKTTALDPKKFARGSPQPAKTMCSPGTYPLGWASVIWHCTPYIAKVQSRLDYANSLLYRVSTRNIHKIQRCQNTAARLILQQSFTPSIQDLMNQLHWLPIQVRIDFKIITLTYKALSSGQTAYLRELIFPYKPSRQLRSSDQSLLTIPRTNLTIGQRAFSWSSVFIWNSTPLSVRNAPIVSTFKRR